MTMKHYSDPESVHRIWRVASIAASLAMLFSLACLVMTERKYDFVKGQLVDRMADLNDQRFKNALCEEQNRGLKAVLQMEYPKLSLEFYPDLNGEVQP